MGKGQTLGDRLDSSDRAGVTKMSRIGGEQNVTASEASFGTDSPQTTARANLPKAAMMDPPDRKLTLLPTRCGSAYEPTRLTGVEALDDRRIADWERRMVARVAAGDGDALAAIYDQYAPLVHGIARRMVGDGSARDVCQEVFLALWRRPDRFDAQRGSLRTFLATIARRRSVDVLRQSGRREAREIKASALLPAVVPNCDETALAEVAAGRLRRALALLPDEQRRAIELAYVQGLTFREVAEATGTAEGTAKSRLRLGLARLAKAMEPEMTLDGG
jgi:RNA polymerase sigma factor (sigma-70 family)